jgi:TP901 family phage tail tape measure protein
LAGDVLGSAFIEIIPLTAGFEAKARAGVESAMRGVSASADRAGRNIDDRFRLAGASVGRSMSDAGTRGGTALQRAVKTSTDGSIRSFRDLERRIVATSAATFTLAGGIAVLGFESIKMSTRFNAEMELIHTQAGASQAEVDALKGSVLALGPATGQGPMELAKGLFHVESAGFRGAEALDIEANAAKGASIGHANLEKTTQAMIGVMAVGFSDVRNAADAMAFLNTTVGIGDMRMDKLAQSIATGVLPTFKSAGLGLHDYSAALATMTDNVTPADEAATRLRMTVALMSAPSDRAIKALKSIGLTSTTLAEDMHKPMGLLTAIMDLKEHLEASGKSAVEQNQVIVHAFGGGRSSGAILTLIEESDRLALKYHELGTEASRAAKFNEAWDATNMQLAQQLARLRAGAQSLMIGLGEILTPVVQKLLGETINLGQAIGHGLGPSVEGLGKTFIPVTKVIGTLVVGPLHALDAILGFIAQHETVFVPLIAGVVGFVAASKTLAITITLFKLIAGRGGLIDDLRLRTMYAGESMHGLATKMDAAKLSTIGFNAIVGVAAIGIGFLAMKHAEAKARVEEFSSAIKEDSGAIGENTRAAVANRLEKDGVLRAAQRQGIALSLVTDAALGNASALNKINDAANAWWTSMRNGEEVNRAGLEDFDLILQVVSNTSSDLDKATDSYHRLGEATKVTTDVTDKHKVAMDAARVAAKQEADALNAVYDALNKVANANLDAQSASITFHASIIALDSSLGGLDAKTRAQTRSLDINIKAGNEARATLIQNVKAAIADGEAQKTRGVSVQRATKWTQDDIASLRAHYIHLGYNAKAVDAVIASIGALAKSHADPEINANTKRAANAIDAIARRLRALDGTIVSTYVYNFQKNIAKPAGGGAIGGSRGGEVTGGIPGVDSVQALLMPGERVLTVAENRAYKHGTLPTLPGRSTGAGAPITVMPGAVQVNIRGSTDRLDPRVIHDVVLEALHQLLRELKTGGRR